MYRVLAALVSAVAVIGLAGCSGGGGVQASNPPATPSPKSSTPTSSGAASPGASPSWDCVKHWDDRYCGQQANAPKLPEVDQGTAFHYTTQRADSEGKLEDQTEWQLTLSQVDCGLKSLPKAADNGPYKPLYKTAKPGAGNAFCVLQWDWENVGKHPGTTDMAGSLFAGDQDDQIEYAKTDKDQEYSQNYMTTRYGYSQANAEPVNPGGKAKTADVYTLPAGAKAVAVNFPEATLMADAVVKVNLS